MVRSRLRRLVRAIADRERTSGEPGSENGASSFHLVWTLPQVELTSVRATVEVLEPPANRRLYFWALQVAFGRERRPVGVAHLWLQWNPRHPGSTAVNWGGYGSATRVRALLRGSDSDLPSVRDDPNTRDYPWTAGHRYSLTVSRGGPGPDGTTAWNGTVIDFDSGEETIVRRLYVDGDHLLTPMVWSEVFARCEHPRVTVRWSDFRATSATGEEIRPTTVRVNYQSHSHGGCANTTAASDELGLLQITHARRQVPQGALLPVPS